MGDLIRCEDIQSGDVVLLHDIEYLKERYGHCLTEDGELAFSSEIVVENMFPFFGKWYTVFGVKASGSLTLEGADEWEFPVETVARVRRGQSERGDALSRQVGGAHYSDMAIQPWEVIDACNLNFWVGTAVQYLMRAGKKDSTYEQDIEKAIHTLQFELERCNAVS